MTRSIRVISPDAFMRDIEWLYETFNRYFNDMSQTLTADRKDLRIQGRRVGDSVVPYYFAVELWRLFEYARGERSLAIDHVHDIIRTLARMLGGSPITLARRDPPPLDMDFIKDHDLAVVIRAAEGRARLAEDEWLTLDEVAALTGLGSRQLKRFEVETRKIKGRMRCNPKAIETLMRERLDSPLF